MSSGISRNSMPSKRYIFDRECLSLPAWLKPITPKPVLQALHHVRDTASAAFNGRKLLELKHATRYKAMCPRDSSMRYLIHSESIDRLLNWDFDLKPHNPTLAPAAKLSPFVLQFHVDQRAYDTFAGEYTACLEEYIMGPYVNWLRAKSHMEHVIETGAMNEMNKRQWLRWWQVEFLGEMATWEETLEELILPSWEEIIDEIYQLIRERVDSSLMTSVGRFYEGSLEVAQPFA